MIIILLSAAITQIIIGLTISDQKKTGWFDGHSILFSVFVEVLVYLLLIGKKKKNFSN